MGSTNRTPRTSVADQAGGMTELTSILLIRPTLQCDALAEDYGDCVREDYFKMIDSIVH